MARIGVSITKSIAFRNSTQEFSNVYYYELDGGLPSQSQAAAIIDSLKAQEVPFHSTAVTFVRGRLWSQAGSPGANNMIDQHNLSGTGSTTTVAGFDRERAYLVQGRAGNDSRGNPVFLRKWYHSCGNGPGNASPGTPAMEQSAALPGSIQTIINTAVGAIDDLSVSGVTGHLCAKGGRQLDTGVSLTSHPFLEHHQLGDQWRRQ